MNTGTFWKCIFAWCCGVCSFLFGDMDGLFTALLAFMVLDYITGLIVGITQKKLDSSVGFKGIAKKFFMLVIVAVGHILDAHVLGDGALCKSIVTGFYVANEGISILENTAKIGVKYPKKLLEILKQLKSESDSKKDGDGKDE